MGQKEKLISKLRTKPKDFTFQELETLLSFFGYKKNEKGRTSGSRVVFSNDHYRTKILLHKPHPRKELLVYQVKQVLDVLEQEDLI